MTTVQMAASYRMNGTERVVSEPQHFTATAYFETLEAAKEYATQFPASLKFTACRLGGRPGIEAMVSVAIWLTPNAVSGAKNETGIKRVKRFLKIVPNTVWTTPFGNAYETLEQFLENL